MIEQANRSLSFSALLQQKQLQDSNTRVCFMRVSKIWTPPWQNLSILKLILLCKLFSCLFQVFLTFYVIADLQWTVQYVRVLPSPFCEKMVITISLIITSKGISINILLCMWVACNRTGELHIG